MDTFSTLAPVNFILRCLGLSKITRKENKIYTCRSYFKNSIGFAIISIITICFIIIKIRFIFPHNSKILTFIHSVQMIFIIAYVDYITSFLFSIKFKDERLEYLLLYNDIDSILEPDFGGIRSTIKKILSFFVIFFVLISVSDYFAWFIEYGWIDPFLYVIDYIYFFINSMTVLDVVSQVLHIEFRLKILVKYIREYTLKVSSFPFHSNLNSDALKVLRLEPMRVVSQSEQLRVVRSRNCKILLLNKSYLLLIEQVIFINRNFGVRIVVLCFNILVNLIHNMNIIIRLSEGTFGANYELSYLPVITSLFREIGYFGVVVMLVYRCGQARRQCDDALRLIDLILVNEKICPDIRKSLSDLRVLVTSRPVRIHAANFFNCDFPLLVSIASAVGTYTIILYQNMK